MSQVIKNIRKNIAEVQGNEAKAINENISLAGLFERRQALLKEINAECLIAIKNARAKHQAELEEIDKEYAMLLQLTGDNKEKL